MKTLFSKHKKKILVVAVLIAFWFDMDSPYPVYAAPYGYNTQYHTNHVPVYVRDVYDTNIHGCGNTVEYNAKEYIVSCGNNQYERYRWGWYTCSSCNVGWGEAAKWVMQNGSWAGVHFVGEESFNNFLNSYLPSSVACPGYDVPWEHVVAFNANGGSGEPASQTKTYGSIITLSSTKPTRKGYTFKNWNTASNGTGTSFSPGQAYGADQNGGALTLYAQWTRNQYKITYNANGGTTSAAAKNYYYNSAVDLSPTASKEGMIFVGWSTNKNATKPMSSYTMPDLATSTNTNYSSDWEVTLYAVYSIPVSDIENHAYPNYTGTPTIKDDEVYFVAWKKGNTKDFRTYPLTYKQDVNKMVYRYTLETTNLSSFVGSSAYCYQILAYDNAGNLAVLKEGSSDGSTVPDFPIPKKYLQTVKHHYYDIAEEEWVQFDVTTEMVLEGMTYTPSYITPPDGYNNSTIDEAYVVNQEKISNAYYMPIEYTLDFNANGGTCDIASKTIAYGDIYGDLPTPTRTGYNFVGWNTKQDGTGEKITRNSRYLIADNSTIYAQWKVKTYAVTYDYWTNGGISADKISDKINYGSTVDLGPIAYKEGWEFVGWNTDSTATTGLNSMTMPAHDVTLYAIYKKDISLTVVNQTDDGQKTSRETKTIYNTTPTAVFQMDEDPTWSGWTFLGWTDGIFATDAPIVGSGTEYELSESGTLYGLYTATVTLNYDTNGSSMVIEDQTKDCYFNAAGDYGYPEYVIADAPVLSQSSFVTWNVESGSIFDANGTRLSTAAPGQTITLGLNTVLKAVWDKHPVIEAYDRYFTLEQAKQGEITQSELLEKVIAKDLEDGTLVNGVDVIVKDYNADSFTFLGTDTEIEITYQATDSFGNVVTKMVTVRVTDITMRRSNKKYYVRFISPEFYRDEKGNLMSEEDGGLEETSVWRIDDAKRELLERVLEKIKKKS